MKLTIPITMNARERTPWSRRLHPVVVISETSSISAKPSIRIPKTIAIAETVV
jgi:hypothetical protein